MAETTWTQSAGMVSDEDTDNLESYSEQAEASKDAAAVSAAAAEAAKVAAAASEAAALASKNNAATSATTATTGAATATTKASEAATSATSASTSATAAQTAQTAAEAAETAAAASETASASSATAASTSETNAATSASAASTSETNAATSASAASTSETNAATSASAASTSATAAQTAQTAAELAETNAETAETNAAASATSANASALAALASEIAAGSSETNAAASEAASSTSETNAAASAAAASTSETNAATSETNAATSETNAANSATASASSATASAGSATASASSATAAAASETAASTSEGNAATSASSAATSATNAATSETNASTSATAAASSASSASASADAALAALDSFDDRYLGQKASDPTLDNDGNALVAGALYFNTTDDIMKVYDGSVWVAAYASLSGALLAANNLSDVLNAATARTNLGLGTAATTASTDYATAAQGSLADSAIQAGDSPSFVNVTVSGTIDGRDVAADGSKLDGIEAGADVTDTANVTAAGALMDSEVTNLAQVKAFSSADYATAAQGALADSAVQPNDSPTFSGLSTTGDLSFGDSDKAIFGAGSDLQIYHDGSNSFIRDAGAGSLLIRATDLYLQDTYGGNYLTGIDSTGEVALWHNSDAKKLATTSTGIDVTGTVTADGLTVDTTYPAIYLSHEGTQLGGLRADSLSKLELKTTASYPVRIQTNLTDVANFAVGGDVSFYEDTGTTPKFFWDASAESLGIGTSSPAEKLQVDGNIRLGPAHTTRVGTDGTNAYFENFANGAVIFRNNGYTERMRIDANGKLLLGTTSPYSVSKATIDYDSNNNFGITLRDTGSATDGAMAYFVKGGAVVGSIVSNASSTSYSTSTTSGITGVDANTVSIRTNSAERMRIDSSGNVGIGTASPDQPLTVVGKMSFKTGTTTRGLVGSPSWDGSYVSMQNGTLAESAANAALYQNPLGDTSVNAASGRSLAFKIANGEKARIDSSGNLLVGQTVGNVYNQSSVTGLKLDGASGNIQTARANNPSLLLNRYGTDGDIARFYKNGSTVGIIGAVSGDMYIATGDTGLRFVDTNDSITPTGANGAARDNAVDLGNTGTRFKDGYFSGTVNATAFVGDGSGLTGVASTPASTVIYVAQNTAPTGYLKANGAAISRTTYADLFAAIGTTFGTGDGSTTFNVPDLRGEFIRAWDDARGVDSGRSFGSAQADELKSHNHTIWQGGNLSQYGATAHGATLYDTTQTTSSTGGTETRPRNIALLACIKY